MNAAGLPGTEHDMSKDQNHLPITDGAFIQPEPAQGDPSVPGSVAQGESWMDGAARQGASPDEHSLLSRPAAPQGRRSLFRR